MPYRLDHVAGSVTVDPAAVSITDLHAAHGPATLALTGRGLTARPDQWDLTLHTRGLPVDADLRRALPVALRNALAQSKFRGRLDLDLPTLAYRGTDDPGAADLDLAGTARAAGASLDVGVPVDPGRRRRHVRRRRPGRHGSPPSAATWTWTRSPWPTARSDTCGPTSTSRPGPTPCT